MNGKKVMYSVMALGCMSTSLISCNTVLATTTNQGSTPPQSQNAASKIGTVKVSDWETSTTGDTVTITGYKGTDKNVVIPVSGDLGCTNVKITKAALTQAAKEADSQSGTLANSENDTSGKGLISDNTGDGNPTDRLVDYSGIFENLSHITSINLSEWNIEAHNGANGKDVIGQSGEDGKGSNGQDGESISLAGAFKDDVSLKSVNLNKFVGKAGRGGRGGRGYGGRGYGGSGRGFGGRGGDGFGGDGGRPGNWDSHNFFAGCIHLSDPINLASLISIHHSSGGSGGDGFGGDGGIGTGEGIGGPGGNGFGGSGSGIGDGSGGSGFAGGDGFGGYGGDGGEGGEGGRGRGGDAYGFGYSGRGFGGNGGFSSNGGFGGNGGRGRGGNAYGSIVNSTSGIAGYGRGGEGGRGGSGYGRGGDGYGGDGYGSGGNGFIGIGGNGYSGSGSGSGFGGYDGEGIGGDGLSSGGKGLSSDGKGFTKDGQINPSLTLASTTIALCNSYLGTDNCDNMFPAIALKSGQASVKAKQPFDSISNVVLRNTTTGADVTATDVGNVTVTAEDSSHNHVDLPNVTNKMGQYTITYSYDGQSVSMTLTVTSAATINVHDSTLLVGDAWSKEKNFDSATDDNGDPLLLKDLSVTDTVDSSKAGKYNATYSYGNPTKISAKATISVVDISLKKLSKLGINAPWKIYDGLNSVTDADKTEHKDETYYNAHVQVSACLKGTTTAIDPATLTANAGTYTLTYAYQGVSRSIDITVEEKALSNHSTFPSELNFGTHDISYEDQSYDGLDQGKVAQGKIDLTDTRGTNDEGEGFTLQAQCSALNDVTNSDHSLDCSISFDTSNLKNSAGYPIHSAGKTVDLKAGDKNETQLIKANAGKSGGETTMDMNHFKLNIPAASHKSKGVYKGTITWTLSNAPK